MRCGHIEEKDLKLLFALSIKDISTGCKVFDDNR